MKKNLFVIIVFFFVIITAGYPWFYQNYNIPDWNVPSYKSANSLAKIRSGELPEQSFWWYRDDRYIWIGPENIPISQFHPIILDDIKHGVPATFGINLFFKIDACTGILENITTGQKWQFFNDPADRKLEFEPGIYKYIATKPGRDYEPNGGFTVWPIFNETKDQ